MAELISILKADPAIATIFGMAMAICGKGLLVLLPAAVVVLASRRLPANQKHVIWFLVIVFFAAIPVFWLILPSVELNLPVPAEQRQTFEMITAPLMSRDQYIEKVILSHELDMRYILFSTQGFPIHNLPWPLIILFVWAIGIFLFLLRLVIGRIAVKRLIRDAEKCTG